MKKFVFATLMCVAAMSAKAQVITSEVVNSNYEAVINQNDGCYAYNAEYTGNDITTMYVYKVNTDDRKVTTLTPHLKYDYTYDADGMLTSRVVSRWMGNLNEWTCSARYDYMLVDDVYTTAYSRYNHMANRFDEPAEKMVYSLESDDMPLLFAMK